ncbi:MAG: family 78 glycoside hydrolase catalytic domain [Lentisphaeria bacterium]|nr:family 78 glycoside hydrolase catalytic domain [Lentisphaeria bacterium]
MLVEYAQAPLAIGTQKPRFSWEVPLTGRGREQSAYQLLVATQKALLKPGQADLWDSGKVESARSVNITYGGRELRGGMDCYWAVRIWDESGDTTGFSAPGYFGTGLFNQSDWRGEWIGMGNPGEPAADPDAHQLKRVPPELAAFEPEHRAPLLRREFVLEQPVKRARAFVCGLGLFELRLNGEKVGDDVLATPRTDFRKRAFYSTYDITERLQRGANALGLILGNGWFNGQKKYWGWQMQWFGSPRAIAQVEIELADGSVRHIVSDGNWRADWSPITFNCLFDGEHVDARLEQSGWDQPGFDDSRWRAVSLMTPPGGKLLPVAHEQERIVETIRPVSVAEPEPGVYVFDLGKNITGWIRLKITNGAAGDVVRMRFGEAQYENGALNASSNNAARQEDHYILKGGGGETFEPRFTFHGFQFVEVTGYPGTPDLDSVTGCFVRTAVAQTGQFDCGHALINTIHRCTLQSQLCNVQMGVPTDDTQRPERQGWGADAWATAREALYNLWMPRVYHKWIQDFCDQQDEKGMVGMITPQAAAHEDLPWSSAFILIPWWQYTHCGDRRILEDCYPSLRRYLAFLRENGTREITTCASADLVERMQSVTMPRTRLVAPEDRGHLQISQWGDHLATADGSVSRSNLPLSIATAFYYLDVATMVEIATVLGRDEDADTYHALAEDIKTAFNQRFYNSAVGFYDSGVQSAQAWALVFGLVPEEHRQRVEAYFTRAVGQTQRRLTTGYIGTKFAIEALSMSGRDDLVWERATATDYPSWGYMLRLNRTTSCERWDGEGGSLNHAPLGAAIDEWFYWGLAGIRPDPSAPGFEHIIFKPYLPKDLPWVKASIQTPRGRVVSEWRQNGTEAALSLSVPANCAATVYIPAEDAGNITESGFPAGDAEGVTLSGTENGATVFQTGSGNYRFTFPSR